MKTRIIRTIAAGLAVLALAISGSTAASADTAATQRAETLRVDTSWG